MFTDQGRAFCIGKKDVFERLGVKKHIRYPPMVHQYLSPNDNNLHGYAKAIWRSQGWSMNNTIEASLSLLSMLTHVKRAYIRSLFQKNFFLGKVQIRDEEISSFFGKKEKGFISHQDDCLLSYRVWAGLDARVFKPKYAKGLEVTADGVYYQKRKKKCEEKTENKRRKK